MNKIFVVDYNESLLDEIKNERLIVKSNSLSEVESQYKNAAKNNKVIAMIITLPYTSVSQLELKEYWDYIPLIIQCYNIGDYDLFLMKLEIIKRLDIRLLLNAKSESVYTDLKILASLGVDCGIRIDKGTTIYDEKLLDLASYYYMSPVPHATIEPFEYILRNVANDYNCNFNDVYFKNPLLYEQLSSIEDFKRFQLDEKDDLDTKMMTYYNHFIQLDACSKCSAFKICNKEMYRYANDCQRTMAEIFEYAELRNELNRNCINIKTICQL